MKPAMPYLRMISELGRASGAAVAGPAATMDTPARTNNFARGRSMRTFDLGSGGERMTGPAVRARFVSIPLIGSRLGKVRSIPENAPGGRRRVRAFVLPIAG